MVALRLVAAAITLAVVGFPASADDARRLSADEIRAQILGHEFLGHFRTDDGTGIIDIKAYFSTAGKLLVQLTKDDKPFDIGIETFEMKGDLLRLHDLRLMKTERPDRCFAAYVDTMDKSWSGHLVDEQNSDDSVPLENSLGADSADIDARWARWEGIRQEAGSIDSFGILEEIALNPFRFAGKIQIMRGSFKQMIGDHRGWFESDGRNQQIGNFIVEGVSDELFQKEGQAAVIVGEFTGNLQLTVEGNDRFLPVMTAKAVRLCETSSCEDYFRGWW